MGSMPIAYALGNSTHSNRAARSEDNAKRADRALRGIEGKRLTYRRIGRGQTPKQEARLRRRAQMEAGAGAQLELFS